MAILIFIGLLSLGTWSLTIKSGIFLLMLNSLGFAFNNVIGEALIVESAQEFGQKKDKSEDEKQSEASKNVSLFFGVKNAGVVISAYFGGLLLEYIDKKKVF